jgi:hypothetical protein
VAVDYRVDAGGLLGSEDPAVLGRVAGEVAGRVFRVDLSGPGFAHLDLGRGWEAGDFRRLLVRLGEGLGAVYEARFGRPLAFVQLGRFDQQVTTEAHRDGAPDESVLLLGYEPTPVASRLSLLDFTRAAADHGLEPRDFLERFNPLTPEGRAALADHAIPIDGFDPARHHVVVINNSVLPCSMRERGMLGVLHKAEVPSPDPSRARMVNSIVLAPPLTQGEGGVPPEGLLAFVQSGATVVS